MPEITGTFDKLTTFEKFVSPYWFLVFSALQRNFIKYKLAMLHGQLINTESRTRDDWINRFWISDDAEDKGRVADAVDIIRQLDSCTPDNYPFPSSLEVAEVLYGLKVRQETLIATLLSDYRLKDNIDLDKITQAFGSKVRVLAENVQHLHKFVDCRVTASHDIPQQAESLRRMLIAMANNDIRAVLIKIAWRLQHLRLLGDDDNHSRYKVAQEALNIFAPLAGRLGVGQLKWEIEDLAFRYINPSSYKQIAKGLQARRVQREIYVDTFVNDFKKLLKKHDIQARVFGRPKHIYSIWKKMERKGVGLDQLFDLRAVRVIVDTVDQCYRVIGLVQETWVSVQSEFDDYIAHKKPNGYQSIHTVIIGPRGKHVEIQIRTEEMDQIAELGVAAHWNYKEDNVVSDSIQKSISSLRQLLDNQNSDDELMEDFNTEVFSKRVYVLTPKGEIIDLPHESTPLDFAYEVHTSIGHRCRGALVNGAMVNLDYQLKNSDQVEILTGKEEKPKRDWMNESLGYIRSASARRKVRYWFRQQDHERNQSDGKALLEQEVYRLGLKNVDEEELTKLFRKREFREVLIDIGRGDISINKLTDALVKPEDNSEIKLTPKANDISSREVTVNGVSNLLTQLSICCKPVPGDLITGFITMGRGVAVHRQDCPNIVHLSPEQKDRLIDVSWGEASDSQYSVEIIIVGFDQKGFLNSVTDLLMRNDINIISVNSGPIKGTNTARIKLEIQIENTAQLRKVLDKVSQLPNALDAKRSH